MKRKHTAIILIGVAVAVVLLGSTALWIWYYYFMDYGYTPLEFSKEAWAAADEEHRGYMLDDLLRHRELKGMSYEEVEDLLGKDDSGDKDKKYMTYAIGYRGQNPRAMFASSLTLIIEFDDNGKVENYLIND